MMISPWDRWYSTSCCLCCHVRSGTFILGVWYMHLNAVLLLFFLSELSDPERHHLTSAELANDLDVMDDANLCIASVVSLLMILICGMATYGAYKLHAAWIIPFLCYQIFDFALNTLVAVSIVVYPNTVVDYLQQLPDNFPFKEEIAALSNVCLVLIVLLFISCVLGFKACLIACVWNCYRYVTERSTAEILLYVTTNDTTTDCFFWEYKFPLKSRQGDTSKFYFFTSNAGLQFQVLLPPYDDSVALPPKPAPPPYATAATA